MPLNEAQKAGVRRHLKFAIGGLNRNSPVGGSLASGGAGYRWSQAFGQLEYTMNNLSPTDEAMLTGKAYAAVALTGPLTNNSGQPNPQPGDTVAITFSGGNLGSPHTVTTTAVTGDTLLSLAARIATTVNLDATMQAAGIFALAPFGTGPFATGQTSPGGNPAGNIAIPVPEAAFVSPVAFVASNPTSSGVVGAVLTALGGLLPPAAPVDWTVQPYGTVNGYLPICDKLEGSYAGSTMNLDLAQAGGQDGATFRIDEQQQRKKLLYDWRMEMAEFLFGLESQDGLLSGRAGSFGYTAGGNLRAVI